jgi:O-6-methylguanine DNA methyltransferase
MLTGFRRKVYMIVKKIPRGKVLTYKQVAEKLGNKNMALAVGNALNKNQDKLVSYHRVIRSDGRIGGYKLGVKKKTELFKKEGVGIKNNKIIFKYHF